MFVTNTVINLSKTFYGALIMLDSTKANEFASQCGNKVYSKVKVSSGK